MVRAGAVNPRHIPNALTIARMLMIPPAMLELVRGNHLTAMVIMAVAGITDGLDGYLARRFDWRSRLGAILDPLADKLLMMASYITLGYLGHIPLWLTLLVVGRDVVIMAGATVYYYLFDQIEMTPTPLSKANTALQVALLVVVVGALAGLAVPPWGLAGMIWLVAASTLVSGLHYVWVWSDEARQAAGGD
ncbi:MAG: CDP-alcohol phosphatidyltransferase family protein [Gammaproteobacteria bacterium]|nr:CDP-alcohol phosphatidyltransferase family protein [Gammaproteobacteria bacterium]